MRLFLALLLGACNVLLLEAFAEAPPMHGFAEVDAALRAATRSGAERYDPDLLAIASVMRDSARRASIAESGRVRWFREYDGVRAYLTASRALALASARRAGAGEATESGRLAEAIAESGRELRSLAEEVEHFPHRGGIHKVLSRSAILHERAVAAHEAGDLEKAAELLQESASLYGAASRNYQSEFGGYFDQTPAWDRLAQSAISRSRESGGRMILVDKRARRCHLYEGGRRVATYEADLGPNWVGDKVQSGDKATPEGAYKVIEKKGRGQSRYNKALLINYPNDEDRARFRELQRAGRVSKKARIGGLIEIHGDGGRGYDWTLGCVALTNRDMDALFSRVSVGTPVVIVGALSDEVRGRL